MQEIQKLANTIVTDMTTFDNYFFGQRGFVNTLWNGVVDPNIRHSTGTNWANNNSESMNHVLKAAVDWKSKGLPELVNILHQLAKDQEREVTKALYGAGGLQVIPTMKKFTLQPHEWDALSPEAKKNRLTAFIKNKTKKSSNLVTSSDGALIVTSSQSKGKKPGQRKRPRAEKTTSINKKQKTEDECDE